MNSENMPWDNTQTHGGALPQGHQNAPWEDELWDIPVVQPASLQLLLNLAPRLSAKSFLPPLQPIQPPTAQQHQVAGTHAQPKGTSNAQTMPPLSMAGTCDQQGSHAGAHGSYDKGPMQEEEEEGEGDLGSSCSGSDAGEGDQQNEELGQDDTHSGDGTENEPEASDGQPSSAPDMSAAGDPPTAALQQRQQVSSPGKLQASRLPTPATAVTAATGTVGTEAAAGGGNAVPVATTRARGKEADYLRKRLKQVNASKARREGAAAQPQPTSPVQTRRAGIGIAQQLGQIQPSPGRPQCKLAGAGQVHRIAGTAEPALPADAHGAPVAEHKQVVEQLQGREAISPHLPQQLAGTVTAPDSQPVRSTQAPMTANQELPAALHPAAATAAAAHEAQQATAMRDPKHGVLASFELHDAISEQEHHASGLDSVRRHDVDQEPEDDDQIEPTPVLPIVRRVTPVGPVLPNLSRMVQLLPSSGSQRQLLGSELGLTQLEADKMRQAVAQAEATRLHNERLGLVQHTSEGTFRQAGMTTKPPAPTFKPAPRPPLQPSPSIPQPLQQPHIQPHGQQHGQPQQHQPHLQPHLQSQSQPQLQTQLLTTIDGPKSPANPGASGARPAGPKPRGFKLPSNMQSVPLLPQPLLQLPAPSSILSPACPGNPSQAGQGGVGKQGESVLGGQSVQPALAHQPHIHIASPQVISLAIHAGGTGQACTGANAVTGLLASGPGRLVVRDLTSADVAAPAPPAGGVQGPAASIQSVNPGDVIQGVLKSLGHDMQRKVLALNRSHDAPVGAMGGGARHGGRNNAGAGAEDTIPVSLQDRIAPAPLDYGDLYNDDDDQQQQPKQPAANLNHSRLDKSGKPTHSVPVSADNHAPTPTVAVPAVSQTMADAVALAARVAASVTQASVPVHASALVAPEKTDVRAQTHMPTRTAAADARDADIPFGNTDDDIDEDAWLEALAMNVAQRHAAVPPAQQEALDQHPAAHALVIAVAPSSTPTKMPLQASTLVPTQAPALPPGAAPAPAVTTSATAPSSAPAATAPKHATATATRLVTAPEDRIDDDDWLEALAVRVAGGNMPREKSNSMGVDSSPQLAVTENVTSVSHVGAAQTITAAVVGHSIVQTCAGTSLPLEPPADEPQRGIAAEVTAVVQTEAEVVVGPRGKKTKRGQAGGAGDGGKRSGAAQRQSHKRILSMLTGGSSASAGRATVEVGLYADIKAHDRQSKRLRGQGSSRRTAFEVVEKPPCKHYRMGRCSFGDQCKFSHEGETVSTLIPCRFGTQCTQGDACRFSHKPGLLSPCGALINAGVCPLVPRCPYAHDLTPDQINLLRDYNRFVERAKAKRQQASQDAEGTAAG